jgi:hypothetical protein
MRTINVALQSWMERGKVILPKDIREKVNIKEEG